MTCYDTTLSDVLDKHVPLIIKTITVSPCVPWFSDEIKKAKQLENVSVYGEEQVFHLITSYLSKLVTVLFT